MKYLPHEKEISTLGPIILTTLRVRRTDEKFASMLLEKVTSVEVRMTHKPWLLILGILVALYGLYAGMQNGFSTDSLSMGVIVVAIILLAAYFGTRKSNLSIQSASTAIDLDMQGLKREETSAFVQALEEAKNERYLVRKRENVLEVVP